ncbi:MAG: urate hydroxylase PuuD [Xanthomonadales bacterium]|nr:urate hydroxylase PuuD [Xanthomonadales bacterium]
MDAWPQAMLSDWLSLLLRWAHFVTGVAWIGASFYFNWLENLLERRFKNDDPLAGDLWAVHGGGFYYLQKFRLAPAQMPGTLHWFKYEAYATFLTGFCLLMVVYWWNAPLFLINPDSSLSQPLAISLSFSVLVISWLLYDGLCRSPLGNEGLVAGLLIFVWFTFLAWWLGDYFTGRASYMHVGAAIGTIMVANVFFVIIPAQKDMVASLSAGRTPDGSKGKNALQRSRQNNYLTLPVLFIMISSHYPFSYGSEWGWLLLAVLSLALVGIRHWFNIRHFPEHNRWVLPLSLLLLLGLIVSTLPRQETGSSNKASTTPTAAGQLVSESAGAVPKLADIQPLIEQHCVNCHAEKPSFTGFYAPPLGVVLETAEQIESQAQRIHQTVVVTRTMPLGNMHGMTPEQRELIARWYAGALGSE